MLRAHQIHTGSKSVRTGFHSSAARVAIRASSLVAEPEFPPAQLPRSPPGDSIWNGAGISVPSEAAPTLGADCTLVPTGRELRTLSTSGQASGWVQAGTGSFASHHRGALRAGFSRPVAPLARKSHATAADATRAGWGRVGPARPRWTGTFRMK